MAEDDGTALAAFTLIWSQLSMRANSTPEGMAEVKAIIDHGLLALERFQEVHSEPERYAGARMRLESLLKALEAPRPSQLSLKP